MTSSSLDCRAADRCSPLSSLASCAVRRAPCDPPLTAPHRSLPIDEASRSPRASRSSWLATLITLLGALHGASGKAPPAAPPAASAPVQREAAAPRVDPGAACPAPEPPVAACSCPFDGASEPASSAP